MAETQVDIQENKIFELSPELLNVLLKDHTLSTEERQVNIFRTTDNHRLSLLSIGRIVLSEKPILFFNDCEMRVAWDNDNSCRWFSASDIVYGLAHFCLN